MSLTPEMIAIWMLFVWVFLTSTGIVISRERQLAEDHAALLTESPSHDQ